MTQASQLDQRMLNYLTSTTLVVNVPGFGHAISFIAAI
jgi:hypothetical protein